MLVVSTDPKVETQARQVLFLLKKCTISELKKENYKPSVIRVKGKLIRTPNGKALWKQPEHAILALHNIISENRLRGTYVESKKVLSCLAHSGEVEIVNPDTGEKYWPLKKHFLEYEKKEYST